MNTLFTLNQWVRRPMTAILRALGWVALPSPPIWLPGERQALRRACVSSTVGNSSRVAAIQHDLRRPSRQLRVVQVLERGMPRGSSGRLFISGAIGEVCAELDRLVKREELMLARPQRWAPGR